jgi:hypothetical protein
VHNLHIASEEHPLCGSVRRRNAAESGIFAAITLSYSRAFFVGPNDCKPVSRRSRRVRLARSLFRTQDDSKASPKQQALNSANWIKTRGAVSTRPLCRHRSCCFVGKGFHGKNHPSGVDPDKARLPRQSCLARLIRGTYSIVTQVQNSGSSEDGSVDSEFKGISRHEQQTNPTYSNTNAFSFPILVSSSPPQTQRCRTLCTMQGLARSLSNVHDNNNRFSRAMSYKIIAICGCQSTQ